MEGDNKVMEKQLSSMKLLHVRPRPFFDIPIQDYQIGCIILNAVLIGQLQMYLLKPYIYISMRILKKM